jgi:hypothetical protein
MLTQLRGQFDVVDETCRLERYPLLILPDAVPLGDALIRRLRAHLKRGGALLATGTSGLTPDGKRLLLPELGVRPEGPSPFSVTYVRFRPEIAQDVPPTDHVMYERGVRVRPAAGAQALARVVEPYFERTWDHFSSHKQTPPDKLSRFAAAVQRGRAAYIAYPIFSAFAAHGNYPFRLLVRNVLRRLLPEPLVTVDGPTGLEATVMRQGKRHVVHLLYYAPERRTKDLDLIEDVVPLRDVALALRLPKAPSKAYLAPEGATLPLTYGGGYARAVVPELRGHAMVVWE